MPKSDVSQSEVVVSATLAGVLVSQPLVDALEAVVQELRTNRRTRERVRLFLERQQGQRKGVFTGLLDAVVAE